MAGGDRTNADSVLLAALAGGATNAEAAKRAGIGESTVYRRLKEVAFRTQVNDARRAMVERAVALLADASAEAVLTLRALLTAESDTARLGAARSILELGSKLRESVEMEARLSELEQRHHTTDSPPGRH